MKIEITARGRRRTVEITPAPDGLTVLLDGEATPASLEPVAGSECWRLIAGGVSIPVRLHEAAGVLQATVGASRVALDVRRALPVPSRRAVGAAGSARLEVRAPMPGLVVAIPVAGGAAVAEGAAVAVIEAMKMQMEVPSPASGRVEEVRVAPGQEVAGGQVLAVVAVSRQAPEIEGPP